MKRSLAWTAIVALFLVGVLTGVAATHAFYLSRLREPGGMATLGMRLLSWQLAWRLDLTAAQRAEVDRILADARGEGLALRRETMARALALAQRSRERIVAQLNPEQRAHFEHFRRRHRAALEAFVLPNGGEVAPAPTPPPAATPPAATPAPASAPDSATPPPAPR